MAVEYRQDSPYGLTRMQGDYLDILEYRKIPYNTDDVLFTITSTYQYRPDLLAFDLYDNAIGIVRIDFVKNKTGLSDEDAEKLRSLAKQLPGYLIGKEK